jgi:hypothetical protein
MLGISQIRITYPVGWELEVGDNHASSGYLVPMVADNFQSLTWQANTFRR